VSQQKRPEVWARLPRAIETFKGEIPDKGVSFVAGAQAAIAVTKGLYYLSGSGAKIMGFLWFMHWWWRWVVEPESPPIGSVWNIRDEKGETCRYLVVSVDPGVSFTVVNSQGSEFVYDLTNFSRLVDSNAATLAWGEVA
jgi:hypothetical protein